MVNTLSEQMLTMVTAHSNPSPNDVMILRKLGPVSDAALCAGGHGCPDIFELKTGDFAVIGTDITSVALHWLPFGSGCGSSERIVSVPRKTLVLARSDVPNAV